MPTPAPSANASAHPTRILPPTAPAARSSHSLRHCLLPLLLLPAASALHVWQRHSRASGRPTSNTGTRDGGEDTDDLVKTARVVKARVWCKLLPQGDQSFVKTQAIQCFHPCVLTRVS